MDVSSRPHYSRKKESPVATKKETQLAPAAAAAKKVLEKAKISWPCGNLNAKSSSSSVVTTPASSTQFLVADR